MPIALRLQLESKNLWFLQERGELSEKEFMFSCLFSLLRFSIGNPGKLVFDIQNSKCLSRNVNFYRLCPRILFRFFLFLTVVLSAENYKAMHKHNRTIENSTEFATSKERKFNEFLEKFDWWGTMEGKAVARTRHQNHIQHTRPSSFA